MIGVHFGEQNEHNGADTDGATKHIEQEKRQHHVGGKLPLVVELEVKGNENERQNHARNAIIDELFAANAVDNKQCNDGG